MNLMFLFCTELKQDQVAERKRKNNIEKCSIQNFNTLNDSGNKTQREKEKRKPTDKMKQVTQPKNEKQEPKKP